MLKTTYFSFLVFAFAVILSATSCNKDNEDNTPSDPFFGKWEIVEASGSFADDNKGTVYDFQADGNITVSKSGISTPGTYTRTDALISIDFSGIILEYNYTLAGETLTMESTDSDQVFILEKQ